MLQPPEEAEQRALEARVAEFMEGFDEGDYGSWESEAEEVTWDSAPDEAKREAIKALFQEILSAPALDIGLARHILRRSRRARVRAILPDVLKNISFLAPVIRDVGLYLEKVLSAKAIEKSMRRFEHLYPLTLPRCGLHATGCVLCLQRATNSQCRARSETSFWALPSTYAHRLSLQKRMGSRVGSRRERTIGATLVYGIAPLC